MIFIKSYARIIFLIIFALIILLLPSLFRTSTGYITEEPYFFQRISNLLEQGNTEIDDLSYIERPFTYSLAQPFVLNLFNNINEKAILYLPILFGIISLILFYFVLKNLNINPNIRDLSVIILLISPPFIYTFSHYNTFTAVVPFLLLIFLLFLQENKFFRILSILLTFFIPFFGYRHSFITLILLLIFCIKEKRMKEFSWILLINIISLSLIYLPYLVKYGLPEVARFRENILIYQSLFSDLGSFFGISIFIIFLVAFGLSDIWKSKYKYIGIYLALIVLIISSLLFSKSVIYLNLLFAYLAAVGLIHLSKSKWDSLKIKKLTIWLLSLGLIFSSYIGMNNFSNAPPSNEFLDGLEKLRSLDPGVVFSHYSNGIFINAIAKKKNVMDSNFFYVPNLNQVYQDSQTLLYTRNIEIALDIIEKYNIKYILISKEMKSGLVWRKEDEGLLFLLESTKDKFKKLYTNNEVEIWSVRR